MIRPPFANYHRAELERMVREEFEKIERVVAAKWDSGYWHHYPGETPISPIAFQVLIAADVYLRTTAKKE